MNINKKNILVLGDSHIKVFRYANFKQNKYNFIIGEVPGATAQGMTNPNSQTNALKIFTNWINNNQKFDKVIIMLGEVDCGFLIWIRSKKYNISVEEQIKLSSNNLYKFIYNILLKKYNNKDIIILGSVLPTILDNTNKKFLNGLRSEVDISIKKRTETTLEYNLKLKKISKIIGCHYIDITEYIYDNDTKIINKKYLNSNPYDHHLDDEKTYKLWLIKIFNIIK